ncbi:uncharacterized protein LOC125049189 [Pieris napi]|uniref:uncharacterized protein LOC125049189 n=1 Tax=Pieris napi TaxID=78633 RepID=UPI001FBB391B|nr:uncharacterized protein LOC125049189 [Pieris napi]
MPALWQSSQRPMYIRTVWVDGFRHAILTHDDPCYLRLSAKRRPYSTASTQKHTKSRNSRLSHTNDELEDCLRLQLVVTNERNEESSVEKLHLSDVNDSEDELNPTPPLTEADTAQFENMKAVKSNRTARTDVKEDTQLCDRVLQWLDLAGKVELLKDENVERMAQPRHSWPEIQKRNLLKSKTSADLKAREPKHTEPKSGPIDRHIYVTTNTIENYARQSRNAKTRQDSKVRERKVRANIAETRLKVATERNAVEKQYAELVSKKLIPDVGKVKKQVHIFMPEALPKRNDSIITNRTQSILSQKF